MNTSNPVRQAALVVAKLDRVARDAVLERMPLSHAESIRDALLSLESDDPREQDEAIQHFLSGQNGPSHSMTNNRVSDYERGHDMSNLSTSIRDLLAHSNQTLARTIAYERATTIASLLSAIPGDRAAGVLKLLTVESRTSVLAILDAGIDANPKVIEAIAEWICDHLAESSLEPTVNMRHRSALKAILDEFSEHERQEMLEDLANENPMLARRLAEETTAQAAVSRDCYC